MDIKALNEAFQKMSEDQLREVNRVVVAQINWRHRQKTALAARAFRAGDLVDFPLRDGRTMRARVERINTKTLSVKALTGFGGWLVSPQLCKLVGA